MQTKNTIYGCTFPAERHRGCRLPTSVPEPGATVSTCVERAYVLRIVRASGRSDRLQVAASPFVSAQCQRGRVRKQQSEPTVRSRCGTPQRSISADGDKLMRSKLTAVAA